MEYSYTAPRPIGLFFDDQPYAQTQKASRAQVTEIHAPLNPAVKPLPRGSLGAGGSLTTTVGNCPCPVPSMTPYISPPQGLNNTSKMANALFAANHSASFQCPSSQNNASSFDIYGRPMTTDQMLRESQKMMQAGYGPNISENQYGDVVDSIGYKPHGVMAYLEPTMTSKPANNFYRQAGIGGYSSDSHKAPINNPGFITNHEVMSILAGEDANTMANKLDFRSGQGSMFNGNRQTFDANKQMQTSYSSMARQNPHNAAEALAGGFVNGSAIIPTFGMVQQGFLRLGVQRNGQLADKPVYRNNPAALKVQNTLQYNGRNQKLPYTSSNRLDFPPNNVLPVDFDNRVAAKCDA
jgi:hypothetical protein